MAYDWEQYLPDEEPSTWNIPSPLNEPPRSGPQFDPTTQGRPVGSTRYDAYAPYGQPTTPTAAPTSRPTTSNGRGGRQFFTRSPTGTTSTTSYSYGGAWPEVPELEAFTAPEWDEREIARLRQVKAGPGLRRLRRVAEKAIGRSYENPNVRRMSVREALEGLGVGMGGVLSAAGREAAGEYGQIYSREYNAAMMNYQAQMQREMSEYQALINKYMASRKAVTTTGYTYE
jgi:hypothetical protein